MLLLRKHLKTIYYSNFVEKVPVYKKDGNNNIVTTNVNGTNVGIVIGYENTYSSPVETKVNLACTSDNNEPFFYGLKLDYDFAMITTNKINAIKESSLVWIDCTPRYVDNVLDINSANYYVLKKVKSHNYTLYALKQRTR